MDINLGKKIAIYLFSFIAISYFLILQQNISVACLFIFCEFTLFYRKCNRENLLLGFVVGVVITIIFYEYNIIKYGNYYYMLSAIHFDNLISKIMLSPYLVSNVYLSFSFFSN